MHKTILMPGGRTAQRASDQLQLVLLESGDQPRWERLVAAGPSGHLLQCWAWGELKRASGWNPLRVALWDAAQERLLAGAQVLLRPIPLTDHTLAYIPRGPVLDWANAALCQTFFTALHSFLRSRKVALLRLEPDLPEYLCPAFSRQGGELVRPAAPPDPAAMFGGLYSPARGRAAAELLASLGFRRTQDHVQVRRTIAIDLTPDEETIRKQQKNKWRYNSGLAARKGVTIRPAQSLEDLQRWYSLLEITRKRDRFAGHTFAYYRCAWELLGAAHQAQLLLAEQAGQLLAGAFITRVGQQGMYLYGASGNEGRSCMPNHLLQWEAMRWARAQGAALYDLWGIADTDDPAHPEAGLTLFKRGWGGQVVTYIGAFDYVYAPAAAHLFLGERQVMQRLTALRAYFRRRT